MEGEVGEELSKVVGVILEEEGEEGKLEVVVVGIGGRKEKQSVLEGVGGKVVQVYNILLPQTPKHLLQSFINTRSR